MTMDIKQFKDNVNNINKTLEEGEPENIEIYPILKKDGTPVMRDSAPLIFTGYSVQAVIDCMNLVFEPTEWKYYTSEPSVLEGKDFSIGVSVEFFINNEWHSKGMQFGAGSALGSMGDSRKAAVSDAFKKALNLWGIGSKPYRGELIKKKAEKESFLAKELKKEIAETIKATQRSEIEIKNYITNRLAVRWQIMLPSEIEMNKSKGLILADLKDFLKKMIEEHKTLGG